MSRSRIEKNSSRFALAAARPCGTRTTAEGPAAGVMIAAGLFVLLALSFVLGRATA
ncbi:MAG: hypothetical protein IMZ69_06185, partial [Spirochaetes bacterium]|nr:hypothetical protein [Spirochaetota bacterium]